MAKRPSKRNAKKKTSKRRGHQIRLRQSSCHDPALSQNGVLIAKPDHPERLPRLAQQWNYILRGRARWASRPGSSLHDRRSGGRRPQQHRASIATSSGNWPLSTASKSNCITGTRTAMPSNPNSRSRRRIPLGVSAQRRDPQRGTFSIPAHYKALLQYGSPAVSSATSPSRSSSSRARRAGLRICVRTSATRRIASARP